MSAIVARYESERMPSRFSTARMYRPWLHNHILPPWARNQLPTYNHGTFVDWHNGNLRIERAIVMQNADEAKTVASRRQMTIAKELLDLLSRWKRTTQFSADTDWIFASPVKLGRLPISYPWFWRQLHRAADNALLHCDGCTDRIQPRAVGVATHATHGHPHDYERLRRRGHERDG